MKACYSCGAAIGFNESYYLITKQRFKFKKREKIGFACENCVEFDNVKTCFKTWDGDKIPESLQ